MKNSIYTRLSGVRFLSKSYTFKFLFIAFLGIHIPLIGLIGFLTFHQGFISATVVFILMLLLTIGASAVTLFIFKGLLAPLNESKVALEQYLSIRKLPDLPTVFQDEAGVLMKKVQETVVKLDKLLEEKKDLIGILSHDIRTPLANIRLLGVVVGKHQMTREELKGISELICQSADEQIALFHDILESLRQDELDWMKLELNEVDTSAVIASALDDVQQMANKKDITLQINNKYNGTLHVEAGLFPQVIKNLLSNSIKFSQRGSTIHLNVDKPNGRIRIEIKDAGIGFNQENAELLFKKFTTKGRNDTLNEPSTGIGLYLSRKIVEAHEGNLYAKSEGLNRGSSFIIEL